MNYIAGLVAEAINAFFQVTGNYGVAIIIVSVILRLIIAPAQHIQVASTRRIKEVEPLKKQIEKRYKGDPRRIQEETLRLYREHKINPTAGCLPMLLQIPIIWAFFVALRDFDYQGAASFLWIADLSQPDPWILPLLAGVTTYFVSKVTTPVTQDSTSQMMLYMMPLLLVWFARQFAAGLALYWVVSNIVSVLQQLIYPAGGRDTAEGAVS
ncbi:MAG: YidC/Oxa1 family membrane protein insertase [Bacillota bacterium]